MNSKNPLDFINRAIAITSERRDECPQLSVYTNLLEQLKFAEAVFLGIEENKSRLFDLTIGSIAVKEFEEDDPELARALKDAYSVAIQLAEGLKIQLPGDPSND
jgi:hypothetical protein